ncbi:hypothetical protein Ddye_000390 [Dipteronia dyeriana]|uniref:Methyl-CpG-binding domain-containing protein 9 n=1 Tax=Dipteronia dyeriana TaxID=168575 RepID=A0AAD9XLJ4_9ROSI|nr:hypothetical protein Ddye_000390 [Dipteronia dyeriana]
MELTDSTRSPLGIDLNEIPATPSADSSHEGRDGICGACGRPEEEGQGQVVICDACERGFHMACSGLSLADHSIEWLCADCMKTGVKSRRWPLGKKKRILDINASPPSDADATDDLLDSRKDTPGDNSFGGNAFVAPVTYSNVLHAGNGFVSQKAMGIMTHPIKKGFEDMLLDAHNKDKSFGEIDLSIPLARLSSSYNTAIRFPSRNPSEIMLLQALRDFVSERQAVLEEGWRVELRHPINSCELYAVYHAPDGKTFDSMVEVACYLGLKSSCNSVDTDVRSEESSLQKKLHLPKKRKSTRFSTSNGFGENKGSLISFYFNELSSNRQRMKIFGSKSNTIVDVTDVGTEENGCKEFQKDNNGFPIQFEDFFILSLGNIDVRPSYHTVSLIFPVGYTSCWHDRITGSLFICEVLDGGDSGPIFKVKRCSCSAFSIPNGSTILFWPNVRQFSDQHNEQNVDMTPYSKDHDNDVNIQIILSDPCPPMENDILACLGSSSNETCDVRTFDDPWLEASAVHNHSGNLHSSNMGFGDEIGEISVEDRSSSSAWRMMSKKFVDACSEIYRRKGAFKLSCKHIENSLGSPNWVMMDEKNKMRFISLEKFCGSPVSLNIPSEFQGVNEIDKLADVLSKWLDQDRYGLDTEFVQEIVEQLPGAEACSRYEFLKDRSYYSTSLTVGNGVLMKKRKCGVEIKEEVSDGLFRRSKKPRLVEDHDRCPPCGKRLCSRLPPQIVGDFYQVWELLWRFHEILGVKEPFSLEELEGELIDPWFDGSSPIEKFEKKIHETESLSSHQSDVMDDQLLPSSNESHPTVSRENPHVFIQMEVGAMKEVSQARLASVADSKNSGMVLTKAHSSLLGILISELQSKVAALVDPNFDSGESKPRRGRKKDIDIPLPSKRAKLNMPPVNELTWPELARRYILSVLSMDGVLDSAEITARESGKVFRCLQGDGGVLCGSLTGVAGMEADALLLAEATKKVFGSLNRENDMLIIEDEGSDVSGSSGKNIMSDGTIPEWAMLLEPVRKLPTNVGTRIRRCVNDALEKNPPDWAKRILEHSISKEVYKGNASGPTKKAVLLVLANLHNEGLPEKSDKGCKRKTVICISDIIMKQCRIVLRHAAAADDEKVFCNLLGRKLMSSTDNDDEGLLGSPAMVSHPLDFRTIDLRLAVGAYGGLHEAFLEDVQELWNNVRMAFGDQPDFVDLAEKLSENFESLYEKEVITIVQKLVGYAKSECLSSEMKKDIIEIVARTSEIPKAPWEEGVCKICGVDKDDDSVLLCDTCDAEYHTYCLDPPLARIPEGNWYCPSCVVSNHIVQDVSEHFLIIGRHKGKKFQGEFSRVYLEALRHLTAIIEEKEYWEFSVDERTFLLKFLCDEVLNSALIRQHLEQCAEATAELQQKLRSFSVEWRNLKSREENLAARVAKVETGMLSAGELGEKERPATASTNCGKCVGQLQNTSGRSNYSVTFFDDVPSSEGDREESGLNEFNKQQSDLYSEKNRNYNSQFMKPMGTEGHMKDDHDAISNTKMPSHENDLSVNPTELPLLNSVPQEHDNLSGEIHLQDKLQDLARDTATQSPPLHHQGLSVPKEMLNSHGTQDVLPVVTNELQSYNLELNTIKNDMLLLQDSVTSLESQLAKLSVRREFLGSDSSCRLYWASATLDIHARVIVDGSLTLQQGRKMPDFRDSVNRGSALQNSISSGTAACLNSEGSKVCCPFLNDPNVAMGVGSQWMFYQTDAEIEELMYWLKDTDPKERELKESILHWKKLRFQDSQQTKTQGQSDYQSAFSTSTNSEKSASTSTNSEKAASFDCLVTKATTLLEKKYGPCFESETTEILKKRGKKARVINEEKMYRCECLELIWPSRNHCLPCHRTFSSDVELEEHNNRCNVTPSACEKSKGVTDTLKRKGNMKSDVHREAVKMDAVETSKSGCSEMTSRLIKFQTEGLMCPYDLEEISSKFMTKDSNKELVQEIGLIGSNGIPSFIPSASPFFGDSIPMLISPQNEVGSPGDVFRTFQSLSTSRGNQCVINAGNYSVADGSTKSAANGVHEVLNRDKPVLGCSEQRDKKPSVNSHFPKVGVSYHCVVPQSSLRPLSGKMSQIARRFKINLLDMDAALPEEALRPSKAHIERRWAWRGFVKSAKTVYEIVQAAIILEGMIKTDYLRNDWWYWSSLSAAAKTCTLSSLALRIYSLDAAIVYGNSPSNLDPIDSLKLSSILEHKPLPSLEMAEKFKVSRRSNKKRKEPEG